MSRVSSCLRHYFYFLSFLTAVWGGPARALTPVETAVKQPSSNTALSVPRPSESLKSGHFFEANLMPVGRYQLDALSHFRAGLTPDLEISLIAWGLVLQPTFWNLGLKHRMFETAATRTSFNSHTIIFKNQTELWLASLHGVVTTFELTDNHDFSLGLMDGLIMTFAADVQSSLHLITPVFAWDWSLTRRWALSLMFARPVYAIGQLDSESTGEGTVEIDFTQRNYNPGLGFLTVNYGWSRASLELGLIYLSAAFASYAPYLNFAWRFGG